MTQFVLEFTLINGETTLAVERATECCRTVARREVLDNVMNGVKDFTDVDGDGDIDFDDLGEAVDAVFEFIGSLLD